MAVLALAFVLAGCSSGPVIDLVPTVVGGLPAAAPARPTTPYQFPAVHDIPPPRAESALSADDQVKMEKDLKAARDQLEIEGKSVAEGKDAAPAKKPPAAAHKPKKKNAKTAGASEPGAKTTGAKTTGAKTSP